MTEYEALAERVLLPGNRAAANPAASVIDLAAWPLKREDFALVGQRIAILHGTARGWKPGPDVARDLQELLDTTMRRDPDLTARFWVKEVVDRLDMLRERPRG